MESVQTLVHSALTSIGAAQALAVALAAGFIMKDYNQMILLTLCALAADRAIAIGRTASEGRGFEHLVQTNWHDFMSLPMGTFLAASIAFGLIICMAFNVKLLLKKL